MKRRIQQALPRPLKAWLRTAYLLAADGVTALGGRQDALTPPRRKSSLFVGGGDFKRTGDEFLRYFVDLAGLQPDDRVLDVGCGIGRMAAPLTGYLSARGSYEGFDIVPAGVRWCRERITPRFPNFHFQVADVYNRVYNPKGSHRAVDYRFPFADADFDFTCLVSVFTHMLPEEMENYLAEIARTLRGGGRCLITYFLLNEESSALIERDSRILDFLDFRYDMGVYRLIDKNAPEAAVAYDEAFVRALYRKYGLEIQPPIRYGAWCGRESYLSGQDIVIATKA